MDCSFEGKSKNECLHFQHGSNAPHHNQIAEI